MIRMIVFLLVAGIVLQLMGEAVPFFGTLAIIAFCGSGLTFLYWLYTKFFSK